jgi:hypothetical protein
VPGSADEDRRSDGTAGAGGGLTPGRRKALVYTLIGIACILTLASSLTLWVQRQLLDTDRWVDTSSQLLQEQDVRDRLAQRLVDGMFEGTEVEQRLEDRLPPSLVPLAAPIAGALQNLALDAAENLLERPAVQGLWEDINRRVHTRLVDVLEGNEGGTVTTSGGEVVLDLSPLIARLEDELGVQTNLSPDAGKITIMTSSQLGAAQDAVSTVDALSPILAIVVVVLLVLAVYLATGFRREAVRAAAAGVLVVGIVLLLVRRLVGDAVVEALSSPSGKPAATQVWLIGTSILGDLALGLVAIAIVGLVWAWLSGSTRPAVRLRRRIAPAMQNQPVLVYSIVLIVALLILWWGPTGAPRRLVGTLVIIALVVAGVEALRRQIAREHPAPASP